MRYFAALLVMVITLSGCMVGEREDCVYRDPVIGANDEGVGYELIDNQNQEVWLTGDFTLEEFEAYQPPMMWAKNQPRSGTADGGEFLRSPGCAEDGQYTYLHAIEKEFLNVVKLIDMGSPMDPQGLVTKTVLEKYHVVIFDAGKTVYILEDPEGLQYILVSRDVNRLTDTFTVPQGWTFTEHLLEEELKVELSENVSVLRVDNEDSFQGPLPESAKF